MQAGTPHADHSVSVDATSLRAAFGQFATGVTVITACSNGYRVGMTANSFTSVSLEPPLVLWCLAKHSSRYAALVEAEHFAVHVLAEEQRDVALAFARRGDAFDQIETFENPEGVPLLQDALARFECHRHAVHDAGDHSLIVGAVDRLAKGSGVPLVFCQSGFGSFDKRP